MFCLTKNIVYVIIRYKEKESYMLLDILLNVVIWLMAIVGVYVVYLLVKGLIVLVQNVSILLYNKIKK